jgi:hypothetical protein
MRNISIAAIAGFSSLVQVSEIEYESKKEMCVILQIFYCCRAADAPSLLTPDVIGAPRQTAPAVVQRTTFVQRLRSRRVSSPHASGHCESASVAASPGNGRQSRAQPFKTPPASRGTQETPPSSDERAAGAWRRIARIHRETSSRELNALLHALARDAVRAPLWVH